MAPAIVPASRVFGNYEQQVRIAELHKKTPVKTVQRQVDRVTFSAEALKAMATGVPPEPPPPPQNTFTPPRPSPAASKPVPGPSAAPKTKFTPMSFTSEGPESPDPVSA